MYSQWNERHREIMILSVSVSSFSPDKTGTGWPTGYISEGLSCHQGCPAQWQPDSVLRRHNRTGLGAEGPSSTGEHNERQETHLQCIRTTGHHIWITVSDYSACLLSAHAVKKATHASALFKPRSQLVAQMLRSYIRLGLRVLSLTFVHNAEFYMSVNPALQSRAARQQRVQDDTGVLNSKIR